MVVSADGPNEPDERPQRRREYSGALSTLGLAALVILVVGGLVWWFEFRGNDEADGVSSEGMGLVPLAEELNPTGRAPAGDRGRAAPDFRLPTPDGSEALQLSDYRGRYVLLNFWADWCAPCRGEAPDLQALAERTGDKGLVVLGVNQQEDIETVNRFIDDFSITYPIVLDRDGDVSVAYRVGSGLPISMLVDPEGVIVRVIIGALTEEDITSIEAEATS